MTLASRLARPGTASRCNRGVAFAVAVAQACAYAITSCFDYSHDFDVGLHAASANIGRSAARAGGCC